MNPAAGEGHGLSVSFGSSWDVEADLLCDRMRVESVEPLVPGPEPRSSQTMSLIEAAERTRGEVNALQYLGTEPD